MFVVTVAVPLGAIVPVNVVPVTVVAPVAVIVPVAVVIAVAVVVAMAVVVSVALVVSMTVIAAVPCRRAAAAVIAAFRTATTILAPADRPGDRGRRHGGGQHRGDDRRRDKSELAVFAQEFPAVFAHALLRR